MSKALRFLSLYLGSRETWMLQHVVCVFDLNNQILFMFHWNWGNTRDPVSCLPYDKIFLCHQSVADPMKDILLPWGCFMLLCPVSDEMMESSMILFVFHSPHTLPCQSKGQDLFSISSCLTHSPHPRLLLLHAWFYVFLRQNGNSLREQGIYLTSNRDIQRT